MRKNNYLKNHHSAFTLAEMMVVMLIMSIILAAMAPVMTTKNKTDNSSPWKYSPQNSSDAYFGAGQSMRALIGQVNGSEADNGKLVINTLNNPSVSHILFKAGANNVLGDLFFNGTSLVLGNRRNSTLTIGNENINIGHDNWSSTTSVTGSSNITIGDASMQSLTSGSHNIGIGTSLSAVSTGDSNIALGDNALTSTTGNGNIAIGGEANQNSNTNASIAIGRYSSATGENSIAIGSSSENNNGNAAQAAAENTIAIGNTSIANNQEATAVGSDARANGEGAVALGSGTTASDDSATALGYSSTASGHASIAIGDSVVASSESSIAIGNIAKARAYGATAIGYNSSASNSYTTTIGYNNLANNDYSTAIGYKNTASGHRSIAFGYQTTASLPDSIAIGTASSADGENGIAIGYQAKAKGYNNVAIGTYACQYVTGSNKTCIGANSGPASGTDWAKDSTERIFIGSKSKFNNGPAVLEVHNDSGVATNVLATASGDGDNRYNIRKTGVVVNGNLFVKGMIFFNDGTDDWSEPGIIKYNGKNDGYGAQAYGRRISEKNNEIYYSDVAGMIIHQRADSDRRLKYVGKENKSGLDKIRQLKVFDYVYKKDTAKTPHVGVIAQDLQKVFPNAVKKGADGFLTIRMEDMFFAVINAIKELDAKYQAQEKRIDALEKRIQKLEAKTK